MSQEYCVRYAINGQARSARVGHDQMSRIVLDLCGGGLTVDSTAQAIETVQEIRAGRTFRRGSVVIAAVQEPDTTPDTTQPSEVDA